jgi:nucleotide-binding universal stress UspA family protein
MSDFKRILVPVDGSEPSDRALTVALRLARICGSRMRLLHAVDELAYVSGFEFSGQLVLRAREEAQRVLDDALATVQAAGIEVDAQVIDKPGQKLGETISVAAVNWEADLIVIGTHARHGLQHLVLGSGAEQVMRRASIPVLVVPPHP